ncbi:MAG: phosphonopyruvate decarboxylase [Caulobacteraceae bacterium]
MKAEKFLDVLHEHLGVDFYTGVPDSQLKALCDTIYEKHGVGKRHIVAANEGAAVGLAAGHYIAAGKPAMVYLQNSGIGNIINPVTSLLDEKVYGIPCVFVVGWRGEPGVKDEPQHAFQGEITVELLELVKIKCFILSRDTEEDEFLGFVRQSAAVIAEGKSVAFVVRKGALVSAVSPGYGNSNLMKREDAIRVIIDNAGDGDAFVSTTGKTSRELFEIREAMKCGHEKDFLTVGSMGHSSMIALGIALEAPEKRVWCIDGDGAVVMHMGSMLVMAKAGCRNLIHIVFNNGAHESVGGMPVAFGKTDFCSLAKAAGYDLCLKCSNQAELEESLKVAMKTDGTCFIEVMVALGSRENLGRPTVSPKENKVALMNFLKEGKQLK